MAALLCLALAGVAAGFSPTVSPKGRATRGDDRSSVSAQLLSAQPPSFALRTREAIDQQVRVPPLGLAAINSHKGFRINPF